MVSDNKVYEEIENYFNYRKYTIQGDINKVEYLTYSKIKESIMGSTKCTEDQFEDEFKKITKRGLIVSENIDFDVYVPQDVKLKQVTDGASFDQKATSGFVITLVTLIVINIFYPFTEIWEIFVILVLGVLTPTIGIKYVETMQRVEEKYKNFIKKYDLPFKILVNTVLLFMFSCVLFYVFSSIFAALKLNISNEIILGLVILSVGSSITLAHLEKGKKDKK